MAYMEQLQLMHCLIQEQEVEVGMVQHPQASMVNQVMEVQVL